MGIMTSIVFTKDIVSMTKSEMPSAKYVLFVVLETGLTRRNSRIVYNICQFWRLKKRRLEIMKL